VLSANLFVYQAGSTPRGRTCEPAGLVETAVGEALRMPKQKTDRGAAKRFRVTGSGKVRRAHAMRSHLAEKKESSRMRRLARPAEVSASDVATVKRMLGL